MPVVTISGTQCAAARALLGWSQDDLARNAQVARATIASFEGNGRIEPMRKNLLAIIAALEAAGVAFIPEDVENGLGAGVRRRKLELQYSNTVPRNEVECSTPWRHQSKVHSTSFNARWGSTG